MRLISVLNSLSAPILALALLKGFWARSFLSVSFQGLYGLLGVGDLFLSGLAVAALSAVPGGLLDAGSL